MNTKNILKFVAIFFIAISFSSCVEDGDFTIPTTGPDKEYANLKTLSEVAELYNGRLVEIKDDITTFGYVISNDKDGNFFKTIIIQDKPVNPTIGFEIRIDDVNLNARYAVGRKVFIKLKKLFLNKRFTTYQIGVKNSFGNGVDRIDSFDYVDFIDRSSEIVDIVPTELKTTELTEAHVNTLVKINNLQLETQGQGVTYADPNSTSSVNRYFTSCDTFEKIIMRTSGFAKFKSLPIPDKKGSITAILNKFRNDYQLFIRDVADVKLSEDYGCFNNPTAASLSDIKALFTGGETRISQNSKIKVVITSDLAKSNISNRSAFAQEGSTAIALRFSDAYDLKLGDEIEISVGGTTLSEDKGLLQLNLATSNIISKVIGTLPTPEVITLTEALTGNYESKLVKIEGVQFKDITKKYAGANTLTSDCTDELKLVSVRTDASFQNSQVSTKKGAITGVMTDVNGPQIYIRDETDVNFTETYACTSTGGGGGTTSTLFFSELADPNNNFGARFIEIYNPTSASIDLNGWTLRRYTNGSSTPSSSSVNLTGNTITAGQAFVIAADATVFEAAFGFAPDLAEGAANTNGDDNFELVDPSGNVVDAFGVPGEDGTGTNHEFEDGRAYRKASVTTGNPTYTFAEWDIWNDSGDAGTTNAPQDAPGNFTPKVR